MDALLETTTRSLRRIARQRQREGRVPGLYAAATREGALVWGEGVGTAEVGTDRVPGPDDQFLIASNTKTFVAVQVMQLRDEGRLSLDDTLDQHVPGLGTSPTIRQALSHTSGMQREPVGDVWETLVQPSDEELVAGFAEARRVGRPHDRFHYSNLLYALLGRVVAEIEGRSWWESVKARILDPLEMTRTTAGFDDGPRVQGYYVSPYDDVARPEPFMPLRAMDPCGGLASTATDLAKWQRFVCDPSPVLSEDTMEEMCQPQAMIDLAGWQAAVGLGFWQVRTSSGRFYTGHTGGMPGHITGVFTHRESGTGGIALMNNSLCPDPMVFAIELAEQVVEHEPVDDEPWRPGTSVPPELAGLRGRWFSEGQPFVFWVEQGGLRARLDKPGLEKLPPSVFERTEDDVYRTVSGRERGEELRVTRRADGTVLKLNWATYLFTREPLAFGESPER